MTRRGSVMFLSATLSFLTAQSFLAPLAPLHLSTCTGARARDSGRSRMTMERTKPGTEMPDVCRGDVPTPGWIRLAQRNLGRVRVGDSLPNAIVRRLDANGNVEKINVRKLFGDEKGVLVGVPGAFTPISSEFHLPEFVDKAEELAAKGVKRVCFVSVNDPYVTMAWEENQGAKGKVLMLSDGNGDLSAALGLLVDLTGRGMGLRCKRFMCVVDGGKVTYATVGDKVDLVSAAAAGRVLSGGGVGAGQGADTPRKGGLYEELLRREVEARRDEAEAAEGGQLSRA